MTPAQRSRQQFRDTAGRYTETARDEPTLDTEPRTETRIRVRDLQVGDTLVYADGNQTVTALEPVEDALFGPVIAIHVDGVTTPRLQPGRAPVKVLR